MNLKTLPVLVLLFGLFSSIACTKEGYYDYPEEPSKLVVSANAVAGEYMKVFINYSLPYYASDTMVKDFKPRVFFKDGDALGTELQPKGNYPQLTFTTNEKINSSAALELSISAPGFKTVSTKTMVPQAAQLAPIVIDRTLSTQTPLDSTNALLRVPFKIELADLPATDSLFAFSLNYERTVLENGEELTFEGKARFVAPGSTLAYLYEMPDGTFLIDKKYWMNNPSRHLTIDAVLEFAPASTVSINLLLEWRTASPDYYKYHLSMAQSGNFNIPLGVTNSIYNNIKEGYGNFSGFARSLTFISIL